MPETPIILALGEILWDLLPNGKQLGGAPANFAYHAAQLGAEAKIISAVGDDPLGHEILNRLRQLNLDTSSIAIDKQHPTGTVTVSLDPAGQPTYTIHENVAWDFIPTATTLNRLDQIRQAACICFGTLAQRNPTSRDAINTILNFVRPETLRIFDINLRQHYYDRAIIEFSLRSADVLKLNDHELPLLFDLFKLDSPGRIFKRFPGLSLIALTRGRQGSVLYAPDVPPFEHPGFPVPAQELADTIGAGDAFTAALATGLLRKTNLNRINENANRLAAYVCTKPGATPPIPVDLLRSITQP